MTGRASRSIEVRGRPESWNEAARTLDVCLSTGATVMREDFWSGKKFRETLSMEPGSIRLDRLNNSAPFLLMHRAHDADCQLGSFVSGSARVESGELWATVRFTDRDLAEAREVEPYIQEIVRGLRPKHSVGYDIHSWRETGIDDAGIADVIIDDWEPYEGSSVVLAADDRAHYRSHPAAVTDPSGTTPPQQQTREAKMATETPTTPTPEAPATAPVIDLEAVRTAARAEGAREAAATIKARDAGIKVTLRATKLDPEGAAVKALIESDKPLDEVRNALLALAADADDAPRISGGHRVQPGTDNVQAMINGMSSLIMARGLGTKAEGNAADFESMDTFAMGVRLMEHSGGRVSGPRFEIAKRMLQGRDATGALGTGHFPLLVAAVANKSLRRGYGMPRTLYPLFTAARRVPDLKLQRELYLDSATDLQTVNEFGDYAFATMVEGQETWQIGRKGRMIKLTPEIILADDLGALTLAPQKLGEAAARTREKAFFTALTGNGAMTDNVAMFHATHGNLIAGGSGAAPSWTQIAAMRKLAWLQTDRSAELIEVELDRFLFPAALESTVATLWAPIAATQSSNVIPDELKNAQHYISPRLDATSAAVYYGFADPQLYPNFVAGELEGRNGPAISDEFDFDSGCLKILVEDYFGIGRVDHRFGVKNTGA